jgi:hypothetical protein
MAGDDLKALTSIYDASLGAKSNETSGRGIAARQQQSDIANFHFQDNLTRSITHGTRILVGAIGTYYDTPRVVGSSVTTTPTKSSRSTSSYRTGKRATT